MQIEDTAGNLYEIDFMKRKLSKNGKVLCDGGDSLKNELQNFINVVNRKETPFVTVAEAVNNVVLCAEIEKHMPASIPLLRKISDFQKKCKI